MGKNKSIYYLQDKKEWRDDLKKFFKFVYNCPTCEKEFGADSNWGEHLCPVCLLKLREKNND